MVRSDSDSQDSSDSEFEAEVNESSSEDEDNDFDASKKASSSTRVVAVDDVKLRLIDELLKTRFVSQRQSKAIKRIQWDSLGIDEYSPDELKQQLNEIIKATGQIRTLGEILADYKNNATKYEFENHPDKPHKPPQAHQIYMNENKEKLKSKLAKEHPDKGMSLMNYAFNKYKELPEHKQEVYKKKSEILLSQFKKQLKEFYAANPKFKNRSSKSGSAKKSSTVTPFGVYRDTLPESVTYNDSQKMWRELHPEKKCEFIKKVNAMDIDDKKISKDEWKILEQEGLNSLPKRPKSVYQLFFTDFCNSYKGDRKKMVEAASNEWKKIDGAKKQAYTEIHEKSVKEYRKKLLRSISELPREKQHLMMVKYKKDLGEERKRKNSNNETVLDVTKMEAEEPPKKKKKKTKETPESPIKIKKSPSVQSEEAVSAPTEKKKKKKKDKEPEPEPEPQPELIPESPKKKKKKNGENLENSPKKFKKFTDESEEETFGTKKKSKVKEPPYPSQTTAHYFATNVFKGKSKNLAEAYKALSKPIKMKYYKEMKKQKQKFLEAMADYIQGLSPQEVDGAKLKAKQLREQQMKEISWHKAKGTDDEANHKGADSSSSDDSDSS